MLVAVANNLGVGFVWHGSSLIGQIAKVPIAELDVRGKLVELFYLARSLTHGGEAADTVCQEIKCRPP